MTYRERREARAERLRGWADTRVQRANQQLESHPEMRHDWAFITQPGHIPERARMIRADDRAHESLNKAASMRGRADGIEDQLASSIYDDDPDAIEQLKARIAKLEAQRDADKATNARYRREHKAELAAMTSAYQRGQAVPFPSYHFQNLSGNINRNKQRLARLEARAAGAPTVGEQYAAMQAEEATGQ